MSKEFRHNREAKKPKMRKAAPSPQTARSVAPTAPVRPEPTSKKKGGSGGA